MNFPQIESSDGRRASEGAQYSLSEIKPYHKEIANLIAVGLKPPEISQRLNLHVQTVRNVANHPVIQEIVSIIQTERSDNAADIARDLAKIAPKAIKLMDELIDYNPKVASGDLSMLNGEPGLEEQRKAATDLLKLIIPKKEISTRRHLLSGDMIEVIKQRCLSADAEEADFTEVVAEQPAEQPENGGN